MQFVSALLIVFVSLWMCQLIDGIPHVIPGLSGIPLWLWLGFGAIMLSWFIGDN
ncbi:MAG: hypothetical protein ACFB14_14660 [Leptolyngbyaceae cyanobacterium]